MFNVQSNDIHLQSSMSNAKNNSVLFDNFEITGFGFLSFPMPGACKHKAETEALPSFPRELSDLSRGLLGPRRTEDSRGGAAPPGRGLERVEGLGRI